MFGGDDQNIYSAERRINETKFSEVKNLSLPNVGSIKSMDVTENGTFLIVGGTKRLPKMLYGKS